MENEPSNFGLAAPRRPDGPFPCAWLRQIAVCSALFISNRGQQADAAPLYTFA
jgi:hypothetical protein